MSKAIDGMIIDHAYGLHVRVHNGRPNEFEASFLEVLTELIGDIGRYRNLLCCDPIVLYWFAIHKLPYVIRKRTKLFLH